MGIKEAMSQAQADQRAAEQARQANMQKDIPQEFAQYFAKKLYDMIQTRLLGLAKSRRFQYYNGMFGRKTNCRYICDVAYRVVITDQVNFFGEPFDYPNPYVGCRQNSSSDYDGYDRILCTSPVIPQKIFRIVKDMLSREGIRAEYTYKEPVVSLHVELPCDSNGNVR